MNILDTIIAEKHIEVSEKKQLYPIRLLEKSLWFERSCLSLKDYIVKDDKPGIIAEFKRKSPSKGMINEYADIEKVSTGYIHAGASALSVLTDGKFFGGSSADLTNARKFNSCPILRKDFIVDEYQIVEARSIGADAILLIAAVLSAHQVKLLARSAKSLGMEVVLELHDESELGHFTADIDIAGINNRNLKDFSVDINHSIALAKLIPEGIVKISESGISSPETIVRLMDHGFNGFLIGEQFMRASKPEEACRDFISELGKLQKLKK